MDWKNVRDDQMVCYKNEVDKGLIVTAIQLGYNTVEHLQNYTTAGTHAECDSCAPDGTDCRISLAELVAEYGPSETVDNCCGRGCCF